MKKKLIFSIIDYSVPNNLSEKRERADVLNFVDYRMIIGADDQAFILGIHYFFSRSPQGSAS